MEEELKNNMGTMLNIQLALESYELHNNISDIIELGETYYKMNYLRKEKDNMKLDERNVLCKEIINELLDYIKKIGEDKFTIFENGEVHYNWGITSTQYRIKILLNILNTDIKKEKYESVKEVMSSLINDLKDLYDNNTSLDLIKNIKKNIDILEKFDVEFNDLNYYFEPIYKKLLYN